MPNRSTSALPVIFFPAKTLDPARLPMPQRPDPLPVGEISYLHFHDSLELAYCVRGSGVCHVEGERFPFTAGDVQIIFPYQKHLSESVDATSEWHWLNLDADALLAEAGFTDEEARDRLLRQGMGLYGILDKEQYPDLCALIRRLVLAVAQPGPARRYWLDCFAADFYALLVGLREASAPLPKLPAQYNTELRELSPALHAIRHALRSGEAPAIGPLAALCGMSTATFRRRFAAAMGISARDYLTACRMQQACRMLRTTRTKVIEVAAQCGYEDISGFNRRFLQQTGLTPSAYRRKYADMP